MGDQPVIHVCGTLIGGEWFVSGGMGSRMMVKGPTLTEAVAALVVALAHSGITDPAEYKLSPLYCQQPDDDEIDPAKMTAEEWERLISDGAIVCDDPRPKKKKKK